MPYDPQLNKFIASTYDRAQALAAKRIPVAIVTIVRGEKAGTKLLILPEGTSGSLGSSDLDSAAENIAREMLADERAGVRVIEDIDVFVDVYPAPAQLIIFGAVHIAQALAKFAKPLGYRVIVVDARQALATHERFPDVDELIVEWPDVAFKQLQVTPNTSIAILTHDPKFDEPALLGALDTDAVYIGAVGSRKTNIDRRQRLADNGVDPESVARIRGPIGLDIGGSTPEEMAISILAEIIAVRHGRIGGSLKQGSGPIRSDK
ncbi:MAG: XdhC family protein [Thermomicrobiales bacterium]